MNRTTLALSLATALAACKRDEAPPPPPVSGPVPQLPALPPPGAPPAMGGGGGGDPARIAALEQVVAKEPNNRQAWVQLGNDYFDTKQYQKAIASYGRALEIKGDDPDVLTDQGVMFRDIGQYDKALANFQKANQIDPNHLQSLFNAGVVYAHDLKLPQKAAEAWNEVIRRNPQSPQAAQARQALQELQGRR